MIGAERIQWQKSATRIGFGVIWAIDAVLKWTPSFRAEYLGMVQP